MVSVKCNSNRGIYPKAIFRTCCLYILPRAACEALAFRLLRSLSHLRLSVCLWGSLRYTGSWRLCWGLRLFSASSLRSCARAARAAGSSPFGRGGGSWPEGLHSPHGVARPAFLPPSAWGDFGPARAGRTGQELLRLSPCSTAALPPATVGLLVAGSFHCQPSASKRSFIVPACQEDSSLCRRKGESHTDHAGGPSPVSANFSREAAVAEAMLCVLWRCQSAWAFICSWSALITSRGQRATGLSAKLTDITSTGSSGTTVNGSGTPKRAEAKPTTAPSPRRPTGVARAGGFWSAAGFFSEFKVGVLLLAATSGLWLPGLGLLSTPFAGDGDVEVFVGDGNAEGVGDVAAVGDVVSASDLVDTTPLGSARRLGEAVVWPNPGSSNRQEPLRMM
mmetsp:Transcript_83827/g.237359  ORF Transcript_83827/g.237359 Transcript_83827/m.237359 type:complete len:392 (+) Transcript_83827:50-1225(+)